MLYYFLKSISLPGRIFSVFKYYVEWNVATYFCYCMYETETTKTFPSRKLAGQLPIKCMDAEEGNNNVSSSGSWFHMVA